MRGRAVVLATAILMAPLGARVPTSSPGGMRAGNVEEDEAVREIIAAFEQDTGKRVELVFHAEGEHPEALGAALAHGQPPDFAFGFFFTNYIGQWAFDGRLVGLSDAVGNFRH